MNTKKLSTVSLNKIIILSLGGSLIVPDRIDTAFLKNFKKIIEGYIREGYKFAIICGGGRTARELQKAVSEVSNPSNEEMDWLGIYATRANALLIRYIFGDNAQEQVISDPNVKIDFKKNILVAAGWLPGCSTDYDAVLLAENLGVKKVINMSNVDYVYDRDPKKYNDAKKLEKISWENFSRLVSRKWKAGMNAPFDPVAAKEAKKLGIEAFIIGKDLSNLQNLLDGKKFKGTIIT